MQHVQKKRKPTKRKALKEKLGSVLQILHEEYPEDAVHRIRPILEEIEGAL